MLRVLIGYFSQPFYHLPIKRTVPADSALTGYFSQPFSPRPIKRLVPADSVPRDGLWLAGSAGVRIQAVSHEALAAHAVETGGHGQRLGQPRSGGGPLGHGLAGTMRTERGDP